MPYLFVMHHTGHRPLLTSALRRMVCTEEAQRSMVPYTAVSSRLEGVCVYGWLATPSLQEPFPALSTRTSSVAPFQSNKRRKPLALLSSTSYLFKKIEESHSIEDISNMI